MPRTGLAPSCCSSSSSLYISCMLIPLKIVWLSKRYFCRKIKVAVSCCSLIFSRKKDGRSLELFGTNRFGLFSGLNHFHDENKKVLGPGKTEN